LIDLTNDNDAVCVPSLDSFKQGVWFQEATDMAYVTYKHKSFLSRSAVLEHDILRRVSVHHIVERYLYSTVFTAFIQSNAACMRSNWVVCWYVA